MKNTLKKIKGKEIMWAYIMLAPAILLFITFVLIPLVSTFVISFCEWDMPVSYTHLTLPTKLEV